MRFNIIAVAGLATMLAGPVMAQPPSASAQHAPEPKSKICRISRNYTPGGGAAIPTNIAMSNDGWCSDLRKTMFGSARPFGAKTHLTTPPSHGDVSITVYDDGTLIAYRPNPGFVGTDRFGVKNEFVNRDISFVVTIRGGP